MHTACVRHRPLHEKVSGQHAAAEFLFVVLCFYLLQKGSPGSVRWKKCFTRSKFKSLVGKQQYSSTARKQRVPTQLLAAAPHHYENFGKCPYA